MYLVDWSQIDPKFKWATKDKDGIWIHENEPRWDQTRSGYYSNAKTSHAICKVTTGGPVLEQRRTNTSLEPKVTKDSIETPAIIPTIKETLNLLDYIAYETGSLTTEDRLKIARHIRVLSKALKEWENY